MRVDNGSIVVVLGVFLEVSIRLKLRGNIRLIDKTQNSMFYNWLTPFVGNTFSYSKNARATLLYINNDIYREPLNFKHGKSIIFSFFRNPQKIICQWLNFINFPLISTFTIVFMLDTSQTQIRVLNPSHVSSLPL